MTTRRRRPGATVSALSLGVALVLGVAVGPARAAEPGPTTLTYTGDTFAYVDQDLHLSGVLVDDLGDPVAGAELAFTVLGIEGFVASCTAVTGADGTASCTEPGVAADIYVVSVVFFGTAQHAFSDDGGFLSVRVPTRLSYTGSTGGPAGQPLTLAATLRDGRDDSPVAGESVGLAFGGPTTGPGSCSALTDATGVASCQIVPAGPAGTYGVTASLTGSFVYASASAAAEVTITVPDSDGDGLVDPQDPDTVAVAVQALEAGDLKAPGHRNALLAHLDEIEQSVKDGDIAGALDRIAQLRRHLDGCDGGPAEAADTGDWVTDCEAQRDLRSGLDDLAAALAS